MKREVVREQSHGFEAWGGGVSGAGFKGKRTPPTGESATSVPDAESSIWDAGSVRGQNGQHPRQEFGALAVELMVVFE